MGQLSKLSNDLAQEFLGRGYTWTIDGVSRVPSSEDIEKLLDRAAADMYDEPDGATMLMTTGRLVIKKDAGHIDVYLMIGEYDGNKDS